MLKREVDTLGRGKRYSDFEYVVVANGHTTLNTPVLV